MQNTMRFSELHCREVINLCDGARMGEGSDLLFDPVCGQITALVVPAQSGIVGLFSKNDCVIPWGCIETPWGGLYSGPVQTEIGEEVGVGDDKLFRRAGCPQPAVRTACR